MRSIRSVPLNVPGNATTTFPLFRATRPGKLKAASWTHSGAVDGTKTVKVRNLTTGVDLTAALEIDGIAALGSSELALAATNVAWSKGDVIGLVYTVAVAGAVAPGQSGLEIETQHGVSGEIGDR